MTSFSTPLSNLTDSRGGFFSTTETLLKHVDRKIKDFVNYCKPCNYLYDYCEGRETTTLRLILNSQLKGKALIFTNLKKNDAALAKKVQLIAENYNLRNITTAYNVEYNKTNFSASKLKSPEAIAYVEGIMCISGSLLTIMEEDDDSELAFQNNPELVNKLQKKNDMLWNCLVAIAKTKN